jgi:hypothetical protein
VFIAFAQIDASFQFWLSATFAVILVAYLASNRLNAVLTIIVALLYLATTWVLMARMSYAGDMYTLYVDAINELPHPTRYNADFLYGRGLVLALGTFASIGYLVLAFWQARRRQQDHA